MATNGRRCKDCRAEGLPLRRPAPHRGPRCATHHRALQRRRSQGRKDAHVLANFGITAEQYDELLAYQGGRCYICRKLPGRRRLSVDHDHKKPCCGTEHPANKGCMKCIRGLLHSKCNSYLGWVKDDPSAGIRMHDYLMNPPARAVFGI